MNNGDMPAMAQTNSENICKQTGTPIHMHMGLTKREHFAGLAMQSLIPVYAEMIEEYSTPQEWLKCHMETACDMADALLTELEKPKQLTKLEKELLEALELFVSNSTIQTNHPVTCEIGEKAIAKAKSQL